MKINATINYESVPFGIFIKNALLALSILIIIILSPFIVTSLLPSADRNIKGLFIIVFCIYMLYVLILLSKTIIPAIVAFFRGKSTIIMTDVGITLERNSRIKEYSWDVIGKIQREIFCNENHITISIGWPIQILIEDNNDWINFHTITKYAPKRKISLKIKKDKFSKTANY